MSANFEFAGNIITILADLPESLRKPMLTSRLNEFANMNKTQKMETVSMAINAAGSIDKHKLLRLIKTWMEVLSTLGGDKITDILSVYCQVISKEPNTLQNLDIDAIVDIFKSLEDRQKEKLIDSLKESILSMPGRKKFLEAIPEQAHEVLRLR